MRIAACIVNAVAAKKICASWHAMVSDVVGEIAALAARAGASLDEGFADGDFVRIVGKAAT